MVRPSPTIPFVAGPDERVKSDDPSDRERVPDPYPTSSEGGDLSLIHRLKARTPGERLRDLVALSAQMRRLRERSKRL